MRLGWVSKVFVGTVLPVFLGLTIFVALTLERVQEDAVRRAEDDILNQGILLSRMLTPGEIRAPALQERVTGIGREIGARITVIAADGTVLADSEVDNPALMENHASRPEVVAAHESGSALEWRPSRTVGRRLLYAAVVVPGTETTVRIARDVSAVQAEMAERARTFWFVAGGALLFAVAVALFAARRMTQPVRELALTAMAVARGDLEARFHARGGDVLARLADACNRMTERLRRSLRLAEADAARLATVLEGLSEGVVAVDGKEQVSFLNGRARAILGLRETEEVVGRRLYELIREPRILGLVQAVAGHGRPEEAEIQQEGPPRRMVQVHVAPVGDQGADTILVLRDMSGIRRLERMRSDFVSNVSHELRTPLASISAALETLEDEAARTDPEAGPRFVAMLRRNAERLDALLEDILALSRFESRPETLDRIPLDVGALVRAAVEESRARAKAADVALTFGGGARLTVLGDAEALRRVADNLIANAITYTPPGGSVDVSVAVEEGDAKLRVRDTGVGIPRAELDRIFERFYRVDKARSRAAGGTGLGLAIVKHAVGLHGGTVSVESAPGQGSTFTVRLPLAESGAARLEDPTS